MRDCADHHRQRQHKHSQKQQHTQSVDLTRAGRGLVGDVHGFDEYKLGAWSQASFMSDTDSTFERYEQV